MINSEKYIKKLEENRTLALDYITKAIDSNNDSICLDIDEVIIKTLLKGSENDKKTNESLCNVRGLIKSLINEIHSANSEEEIVNVRKKLNYYLNRVKSIMKQKETNEDDITLYSNIIKELRNNIGEYLRAIKRKDYIVSLKELASKENLTEEEEKLLVNSYERERRFNTRLLKKYNPNYKNGTKSRTLKKSEEVTDTVSNTSVGKVRNIAVTETAPLLLRSDNQVQLKKCLIGDGTLESTAQSIDPLGEQHTEDIDFSANERSGMTLVKDSTHVLGKFSLDFKRPSELGRKEFKTPEELLRNDFSRYNLVKANIYGYGLVKDLGSLFKNIPIYFENRHSLRIMIRDFTYFCPSESLSSLINFTIYENSFKEALKKVFSPRKVKSSFDEEMDYIRDVVYNDSEALEPEILSKKI